jgi:pimeloyl-ACP methyl ester carboxylesterase
MATVSRHAASAEEVDVYGSQGRSQWLGVDWREHQRWVRVGPDLVDVIDLGAGDPIVFIHGLSGSWQNWLEQLPVFAEHYRVIAFDLPGFGQSPMPAEQVSIAGYGRLVGALLDELEVPRAVIVGNSMGGFIGAELAISEPQRVERLVLVSAAGLSVEHQRDDRALAVLRRLEARLAAWGGWVGSQADRLARRRRYRRALMSIVSAHPDRLSPALVAEQLRGSGKPGFVDALDALTSYPIRDRLGRISCPTLIVWGEDDRLVPVRDAYEFEELIPDSRRVVYADTGHVAMLERPAAFNALLEAFMAEEEGAPAVDDGDIHGPELPDPGRARS